MSKTRQAMLVLFAAIAGVLSPARGQTTSDPIRVRTDDPDMQHVPADTNVLATVNGAPITEADVRLALNSPAMTGRYLPSILKTSSRPSFNAS